MRSMCVGVAETGVGAYDDPLLSRGEHCSPAKKHKDTFLFWYFCVTKSTKSHQRECSSLFEISPRVHELVARAMRGECVRHGLMVQVGGFTALRNLGYTTRANISHEEAEQIRARIVCTPAESAWRGLTHMRSMCVGVAETGHRGCSPCADGTIKINPISLCSHPYFCPNSNREVRHSLTWHRSESESALKRFEPVTITML